jgi:hypothetical protein
MRKLLLLAAIPLAATLGGGVAIATGDQPPVRHDVSQAMNLAESWTIAPHATVSRSTQCESPAEQYVSGGGFQAPTGVTDLASKWGGNGDWVATFHNTTKRAAKVTVYVVCLS